MSVVDRGRELITVGSISRDDAAARFPFLAERARARRTALKEFTHRDPELVFWISPEGRLLDAGRAHRENPPPGHAHILDDEPDYGGFLRGRIARLGEDQLIAIYCRPEALAVSGPAVQQLMKGLADCPVPLEPEALVVSDNGDLYGTLADLAERAG